MNYITTITNIGLVKIAEAIANETQIDLVQMAVGDGNGSPTNPTPTQSALVREVYRANLNQLSVNDRGNVVAEMIIPPDVGGFSVREIGIFTSDGQLFAVGNLPQIDKPDPINNSVGELVLRMVFAVENASVINLSIDYNAITATQQWVEDNFSLGALIPGGLTNQILAKKSNLDGDTEWRDPSQVNVVVDTLEEEITLAAAQQTVTLSTVTTTGLAVYVNGLRLSRTAWTADSATQITLSITVNGGEVLTLVQNDPASNLEPIKVGQVILLGLTTNPADVFGYGQWQRIAEGRALFGYKPSEIGDTDHNTIGKIGGTKTHTHTGNTNSAGSHNHSGITGAGGNHSHGGFTGAHTLSVDELPAHSHQYKDRYYIENSNSVTTATNKEATPVNYNNGTGSRATDNDNNTFLFINGQTETAGGNEAHDHAIPNSGTHTHPVSSDGSHTHTITTVEETILPPYYTVAIWQRVA